MSSKPVLDVGDAEWGIVQHILQRHVPEREVWAFGSRAKWTAKKFSDLDLAIIGEPPLTPEQSTALAEAFAESDLPWKVDVVDWATTSPSFRQIIERDKVVVQKPSKKRRGWCMSSEWPTKRLGDSCEKIGSGATPKGGKDTYLEFGPIYLIRSQNVHNDGFSPAGLAFISEEQAKKLDNVIVEAGDVLLNITGDSVARVCQAPRQFLPARVNQHVAIIRPKSIVFDACFLRYFLASPAQQDYMLGLAAAGATRNALTKGMIESLQVPCPPLPIQQGIGDILAGFDDRITLLRETNATLEAIAQALFKSWFVDFDPVRAKMEGRPPEGMDEDTAALFPDALEETELGLVPRGWQVGQVCDLGEVVCGKTPPTSVPENYGGEVPFITIPDMHNLLVVTSTVRMLSKIGADSQAKKYLPPGSICVSCIATPGLVVRVTTTAQTNQQINTVIPSEKRGNAFSLFLLRRIGQAVRSGGSGGSVFHNLSKSGFEKLPVLLPTPDVTCHFNKIAESLIRGIIENQEQAQTLSTLRDTLLPRLISGQLRLPAVRQLAEEAC